MTAQTPDRLIYGGDRVYLFSNPLESYFEQHPPYPPFESSHSGLARGYVALWAIVEGRLYLMAVNGRMSPRSGRKPPADAGSARTLYEIPLADLIPGASGPVRADWYSGVLCVPQGRIVEYVHQGYASCYERYLLIVIESGKVISTDVVDGEQVWPKSVARRIQASRDGWRGWLRRLRGRWST